eukprot:240901-Prorocentrum_minimum.AAC.9
MTPFVSLQTLTREIASGSYAQRYGVTLGDVQLVWENLCKFIIAALKSGKKSVSVNDLLPFEAAHARACRLKHHVERSLRTSKSKRLSACTKSTV